MGGVVRIEAVLAIVSWGFALTAGSAPLAFVAKGAGSFAGSGVEAYITAIASARLTRPGVDDIVVARGVFPPTPATNIPLRLLAPQSDWTVIDVTAAALGPNPPARTHPREIIFGDINGDGLLDIFVAAHGYDQPPFTGETNVLLLSRAGGTYADATAILPTKPDFSHSAVTGDINGDGKSDICVINIYSQLFVGPYCLLGNRGTAFAPGGQLPSYATSLVQKYTTSIMLDVDGDGHPDLVLGSDANGPTGPSIILFNDGTGDFTKRNPWSFPPGLFGDTTINLSIAVIDINADGFPDLLFSQTSLNYVGHAIQVFINDHHGRFVDQTATYLPSAIASTGPWLQFIRILDLNGDGVPDIYAQGVSGIAPTNSPVVFAWVSDAPGHYVPVDSSVIGGSFPFMVVFADLDGDGLPDLISLSNGPLGQTNYKTFQNVTPKVAKVTVTEFYNAALDHYFITYGAQEISDLDNGVHKGWARTGYSFNAYTTAQAGTSPVCRFYIPPALGDSHFFGRGTAECDATGQKNPTFTLEDPAFMQMFLPAAGVCPANTTEVYRVFSNRADANHRYMTDKTVRQTMVDKGWLAEGDGPNLVVMCAPQ